MTHSILILQEKEQKIHDDLVLREVLRKKSDAKKSISKLEALAKLRKARQNTAKGRGVHTSEGEAATFNASVGQYIVMVMGSSK